MTNSSSALSDGETVVLQTRPHPKVLAVAVLIGILALAVGVVAQVNLGGTAALVVWIVVGLVAVWWVLRPIVEWVASSYTVTDRRLITRSGILVRRRHDIRFGRVSDVESEVSLIDRIFGCGTIIISDASNNGSFKLHDVPHVEDVHRTLSDLLHTRDADDERAEQVLADHREDSTARR